MIYWTMNYDQAQYLMNYTPDTTLTTMIKYQTTIS